MSKAEVSSVCESGDVHVCIDRDSFVDEMHVKVTWIKSEE